MVMGSDSFTIKKIRTLADMQMGPTILQKDLSDDGLPVFSAGNQEQLWGFTNKKVKAFPKGTLVVSARGTIGIPKLPQLDSFTCTQTTIAVQAKEGLDIRYLFYFLHSINWDDVVSGVAIPMLTISKLGEVDVPVPSMEEQLQIVDKLDAILSRVRQVKARLEKITMLKDTFMSSMASEISDENVSYKLGEYVAECIDSIGNDWQSFPRIGVNKNSGIEELRSSKQTGFERYKIVRKGDIVYNPMRVNIGSIALYEKEHISITSPDYVVFRPIMGIPSIVVFSFLKSPDGLREINNNTHGAVRERLYYQNLCKIKIGSAIIDNAPKYQSALEWFHSFTSVHNRILIKLDKLEQSILARAFRGEL